MRTRHEVLLFTLLAIWGLWGGEFYTLLPKQAFASAEGTRILAITGFVSLILSAIVGGLCLFWPSKLERQQRRERKEIGGVMTQRLERMSKEREADRLRDLKQIPLEGNQPQLRFALSELNPKTDVKRIEVWLPNGETLTHEARFCFITIINSGKRTAKDVKLYCGVKHMLLMPFKEKADYKVNYRWDREHFEGTVRNRGIEAYVLAALNGVDQKEVTDVGPGPIGERFALFFTVKDFNPLIVPGFTRIYEHPHGSPPRVNLTLQIGHEEGVGYYVVKFEVMMEKWDKFTPRLVETVFHPFSENGRLK
ncbi:MAG: hypothetical protein ACLP5V_04885 [Candidatus Bathyarchaeia archaeon]